jgi:hypothetical protein
MLSKSSLLLAALMLVIGVLTLLPLREPVVGVPDVEPSPPFFAAFSASRFCFDADGGMVVESQKIIRRSLNHGET